jgi:TRAP-type C4-dicarboxylate transport system permease small subunit
MIYGGGSKAVSMLTADFPKILPVLQVNEGYFYTVLPLSGLIIVLTSLEDMVGKVRLLVSSDGAVGKGAV